MGWHFTGLYPSHVLLSICMLLQHTAVLCNFVWPQDWYVYDYVYDLI